MNSIGRYAPMSEEEFRSALRSHNLKATEQRLAVHRAMSELGHASADMVAELLQSDESAKITVASVYNILNQLAEVGIYNFRLSRNNKMYFDVNSSSHLHLYDTVNNEFKDVLDDAFYSEVEQKLRSYKFRGYKVDAVDVQIICHPSTRKKKKQL